MFHVAYLMSSSGENTIHVVALSLSPLRGQPKVQRPWRVSGCVWELVHDTLLGHTVVDSISGY